MKFSDDKPSTTVVLALVCTVMLGPFVGSLHRSTAPTWLFRALVSASGVLMALNGLQEFVRQRAGFDDAVINSGSVVAWGLYAIPVGFGLLSVVLAIVVFTGTNGKMRLLSAPVWAALAIGHLATFTITYRPAPALIAVTCALACAGSMHRRRPAAPTATTSAAPMIPGPTPPMRPTTAAGTSGCGSDRLTAPRPSEPLT